MPNQNPIKQSDPGNNFQDFTIPSEYAGKIFCISTKTELENTGWVLDLVHALAVDGDPVDFSADPDIHREHIARCSALTGRKLTLVSTATRIREGGDPPPPKVIYTVTFSDEDGNVIGEFGAKSGVVNPAAFYISIRIILMV